MITYQDCGVDPQKNDELVNDIKNITNISTGFATAQKIPESDVKLIQCSDGVGTKIQMAKEFPELYNTIGQDLVAMCVNDLICTGGTPAYFQDYIGMNSLDKPIINSIIKSINDSCKMCDVVLTGGEMAEMPDTYIHDTPELVGFATGFCKRSHFIDLNNISRDDVIIGLASSGPHSNGYSLIRNAIPDDEIIGNIRKKLIEPTTIYSDITELHDRYIKRFGYQFLNGMAHITGGGLIDNLYRIIPDGLDIEINKHSWKIPDIFDYIQYWGEVSSESMWNTFNMGIGMCLIIAPRHIAIVRKYLSQYNPKIIGKII